MLTPNFFATSPALTSCRIGPNIDGDSRQEVPLFDSIHMLHTSLSHTDRSPCLYLWEKARFCQTKPLNRSKQDVPAIFAKGHGFDLSEASKHSWHDEVWAPRWHALRELPSTLFLSGAAELTAPARCKLRLCAWPRYLDSIGVPVIWASRAATAERKLSGITFA
jgi:hypothetical protein